MTYTMIIEQTRHYRKRISYISKTNTFVELKSDSLMYSRNFKQPYGWIKESGTPPAPHWDVFLMTNKDYSLGDEVSIRVIGVFKRNDGDNKYIAVEHERQVFDFSQLENGEKEDLYRLYPIIGAGEGWFGRDEAEKCLAEGKKAL